MVNVKCPSLFTFSRTFLKDFIETMQKQTMKTSVLKPKRDKNTLCDILPPPQKKKQKKYNLRFGQEFSLHSANFNEIWIFTPIDN